MNSQKKSKEKDIYICPNGKELKKTSTEKAKRPNYRCEECNNCPNRDKCTTNPKGRSISPNEYEENYNVANKLFAENTDLYKKRQMIAEHPFGTIKRALGYTYFLQRGHENVKAESVMHFLVYNLKRVLKILGTDKFIEEMRRNIQEKCLFNTAFLQFLVNIGNYSKINAFIGF